MTGQFDRRGLLRLGGGLAALTLLSACQMAGLDFGPLGSQQGPQTAPQAPGELTFGNGPVRVAMLLPLTGDASLAAVGVSMANATQLAMNYVAASPKIGDNITLVIKDTGSTAQGAAQQASAAISEGAKLILGPLKGDQVQAAGAVAKSAGVPLIGFSNNAAAAAPGVYLLNVLPEVEVHRSLTYAIAHGHKAIAAVFPSTDFGRAQQAAFQQTMSNLGLSVRATYNFTNPGEEKTVVNGLAPQLRAGAVDALFLPDRATAPAFATMLQRAGVPPGKVLYIGSADWDMDPAIIANPALVGAIYPAVDDTGYQALKPEYMARFGTAPHPLATIAYTAAILANAAPLALAKPPYSASLLTTPGGFNGRDGVFRFFANGHSQYALVIKQIAVGAAEQVDGPKL